MADQAATRGNAGRAPVTIIVRRDDGDEQAHHGGAWKVAYADFITALMAFFMLMWLLNATTEAQRVGLADYFAPTNLFGRSTSGSGEPFGGKTPNDTASSVSTAGIPEINPGPQSPRPANDPNDNTEKAVQLVARPDTETTEPDELRPAAPVGQRAGPAVQPGQGRQVLLKGGDYAAPSMTPSDGPDAQPDAAARQNTTPDTETMVGAAPKQSAPQGADAQLDSARLSAVSAGTARKAATVQTEAQREQDMLEQAGARLMDAIRRDPTLMDAVGQILIDTVPDGLRIQAVDKERQPMFAVGSAAPTSRVRNLMQKVVPTLATLPNAISIAGHTDSLSYRGADRDNWDLSSERANATRRILVEAGLSEARIRSVTGNADRDLLVPNDPLSPANRRIAIVVLRHATTEQVSKPEKPKGASEP